MTLPGWISPFGYVRKVDQRLPRMRWASLLHPHGEVMGQDLGNLSLLRQVHWFIHTTRLCRWGACDSVHNSNPIILPYSHPQIKWAENWIRILLLGKWILYHRRFYIAQKREVNQYLQERMVLKERLRHLFGVKVGDTNLVIDIDKACAIRSK